ncbi:hypothetical protein SETIT_3G297300v2 [Setaria italica]|uniref:Uncharacterized protein n=1 Tax=Setaria italica TaxID=4555 RepID=A0A368QK84_SETIT|nr:hypothetical protein SETIT_3G297300v2 [Setaria italica]
MGVADVSDWGGELGAYIRRRKAEGAAAGAEAGAWGPRGGWQGAEAGAILRGGVRCSAGGAPGAVGRLGCRGGAGAAATKEGGGLVGRGGVRRRHRGSRGGAGVEAGGEGSDCWGGRRHGCQGGALRAVGRSALGCRGAPGAAGSRG